MEAWGSWDSGHYTAGVWPTTYCCWCCHFWVFYIPLLIIWKVWEDSLWNRIASIGDGEPLEVLATPNSSWVLLAPIGDRLERMYRSGRKESTMLTFLQVHSNKDPDQRWMEKSSQIWGMFEVLNEFWGFRAESKKVCRTQPPELLFSNSPSTPRPDDASDLWVLGASWLKSHAVQIVQEIMDRLSSACSFLPSHPICSHTLWLFCMDVFSFPLQCPARTSS